MKFFKNNSLKYCITLIAIIFIFILLMPKSVDIEDYLDFYKYQRFLHEDINQKFEATGYYELYYDPSIDVEFFIKGEIKNNIFNGDIKIDGKIFEDISLDLRTKTPTLYVYEGSKREIYGHFEHIQGNFSSFALIIYDETPENKEILLYNLSKDKYIKNNSLE